MTRPRQIPPALGAACALAMALGALLPFVNLDAAPFWVDEAIAALPAERIHHEGMPRSPFDLDFMPWQLRDGVWDPATPLYRYALAGYTALVGFSTWTARSFSVLAGVVAALPLFLLARRLHGPRVALLAVSFFLLSPTFAVFAREARHPTFVILLSLGCLYFLHVSAVEPPERAGRAPLLAFGFGVATLLSQTLGYALLPVAGLYVALNGPRRFLPRAQLPGFLLLAAVYLAIVLPFAGTLPFFHEVSCTNRAAGCQPSATYYVGVLNQFLSAAGQRHPHWLWGVVGPGPLLFALGLGVALLRDLRRDRCLLLLWLLVPFLLLSTRDVKFPRYLFIWAFPASAVLVALGVDALARWRAAGRLGPALALVLGLATALGLQLWRDPAGGGTWNLGLVRHARYGLLNAPTDNWQRTGWAAAELARLAGPDDEIVTSLDDATLQFLLGRFVHGFLNSRHDDDHFLALLDAAEARGARVWFVDTLPHWNYCLSDAEATRSVDCRERYPRFYNRCLRELPPCRRLAVGP